jgi:predicted PurR-regulated permease PerM
MDEPPRRSMLELSPRQQTAVGAALTILSAVIIVCAVLGLAWIAVMFGRRFSHVFLPVALGGIVALVFRPYYQFLRNKLRLPTPVGLLVVFFSVLVPIAAFGWFFGAIAVDQIQDLFTRFPAWWERTGTKLEERWPQVLQFLQENPWGQRLQTALESQQENLVRGMQLAGGKALSAGRGILGGVGAMLSWAVFPVYFVFFLIGDKPKRDLGDYLPFLKPETREDVAYLIGQFVDIVVAFFRGQLIIAFLQGLLFAIGFAAVGLKYGFLLGLLLGFLNVIPYLGSMIGLGIGLPLAYFQEGGGWGVLIAVLVVFAVVQLIESYVLTPRIMGDRTGLHPMAIIFAVFFWGSALQGILGMILAIPLTAFLVVFWRLAREKYIGELV